jgi:NAD(P)H-dependent FMN reductase/uncharacterized protein YndB with AHSA1/START domain
MKRIIAISGSLKRVSSNTALLKEAQQLAPDGMVIELYSGIGDLPHFNPDIDGHKSPDIVKEYRKAITEADGVLLCTPEYAFAVPGVLKNSLDWLVASGEYMNKPVMAISASPLITGGSKAHASLVHTLKTISANVIDEASLNIGAISKKMDADGNLTDEETMLALKSALRIFEKNIIVGNKLSMEASTVLNVPVNRVWQALTDPALIKEYMFGTNTESDWKKGSTITYSGLWEGKEYKDSGTIVEIIPEQLLHTTYYSPLSGKPDLPENYANVIYEIKPEADMTILTIKQDNLDDEKAKEYMEGNWDAVLKSLKALLEK